MIVQRRGSGQGGPREAYHDEDLAGGYVWPSAQAARIEGSKSFAKQVMAEAGVPTAASATLTSTADAVAHLASVLAPILAVVVAAPVAERHLAGIRERGAVHLVRTQRGPFSR